MPVFGGTPAVSFARDRQPQAPAVAPGVEIIRVVRSVVGNYGAATGAVDHFAAKIPKVTHEI